MSGSNEFSTPPMGEESTSQVPALDMLQRLGWTYITPAEANELRGGDTSSPVLTRVLEEQIQAVWQDDHPDEKELGTEAIRMAMDKILKPQEKGLLATNEAIWHLLQEGTPIPMTVDGKKRNRTVRYIDWGGHDGSSSVNSYHVTEEFAVDTRGSVEAESRRPDIVCFVNGIPFAVIECKASSLSEGKNPIEQAISQQLRNQGDAEIPHLYRYAQLLAAISVNQGRYAATGTPLAYWHRWREKPQSVFEDEATQNHETFSNGIPARSAEEVEVFREKLLESRDPGKFGQIDKALDLISDGRMLTEQDRLLISILTPARLLELTHHYTLFDDGARKIARYQQYFCVKKYLLQGLSEGTGSEQPGIIWHTQGSGKSLTMVLLAKALFRRDRSHGMAEEWPGARTIVVAVDRVDLQNQIRDTFRHAGLEVQQAHTGKKLYELLQEGHRSHIIVTTVHKLEQFTQKRWPPIDEDRIFVFVDEGHRSHTGAYHASMRRALPSARYLCFTGTPIFHGERMTGRSFGEIFDTYTIEDAITDGAVVELIYEGRYSRQRIDAEPIDAWIRHHTSSLSEEQADQLKRRFASIRVLKETKEIEKAQALDISLHFKHCFQKTTDAKAQLVTPNKASAIRYKKYLDELGIVSSEVMISAPDTREGHTGVDSDEKDLVQEFYQEKLREYGSEERYRTEVIRQFKETDHPEIIIVVDMLLTGFDAPRNSCLYLTRALKEHQLLQAIARVNRVHSGKEHGLIIDYIGIQEWLQEAVRLYSGEEQTRDHLDQVLTDVSDAIDELPDLHKTLQDCFQGVAPDQEAREVALAEEDDREAFYRALSTFARRLKLALGSERFFEEVGLDRVEAYREDLRNFMGLRRSVALRYGENLDFGQYEKQIRKLLDENVGADAPETIVEPTSVFNVVEFQAELGEFASEEGQAEMIANRIERTITERMDEDPPYYSSLSAKLEQALEEYRERRMQLSLFRENLDQMVSDIRERKDVDEVTVYEGVIEKVATDANLSIDGESRRVLAQRIEKNVEEHCVIGWQDDLDAQNRMKGGIEDEIFEWQEEQGVQLEFDAIDIILDQCVEAARARSRR